jgi:hypothetical protein
MRDKAVAVTGGCLCGAIRYEAEVFARSAYICHCTLCQKSTGQPFEIGVPVKAGTFRWIKGEPTYYMALPHGRRAFCPTCASRLAWVSTDPAFDWTTNIDPCCLDDPSIVRPCEHIFVDTRQPWFEVADSLPRYREDDMDSVVERWRVARTADE